MDDLAIIALYWQRKEQAIAETDRKYGSFCRTVAQNILSVLEDAEECVNDTYQRAWNAIPPARPTRFRAWLGCIVRNLALDRWHKCRAQKRYNGIELLFEELEECIPATNTVEQQIEAAELGQIISKWLYTLSLEDRNLFIRRYWNGEALQALANQRGINPNRLAQRMHRLRLSLKQYLEKEGVTL